jgi:hypothetical protein
MPADVSDSPSVAIMPAMAQPCFPWRRQQAGRFDSESANHATGISDVLNNRSSATADTWRNA